MNILIIEGVGLHNGKSVEVHLISQKTSVGIKFFKNTKYVENVITKTELSTTIGRNEKSIATIEHFMSLFYALGIFNIDVHVLGDEMPILDGSALGIYDTMVENDFIVENMGKPDPLIIDKPLMVESGDSYIKVSPCDCMKIKFSIDFDHPLIGYQEYEIELNPERYINEIAPARTFGFYNEYTKLKELGYAKGGTLDNVIVLTDDGMMNDSGLRFPDEFVRHKILDLIGDFSLLERPIHARIEAHKSGHTLNAKMIDLIKKEENVKTLPS